MTAPHVSVLMGVHDGRHHLGEAVESVLAQTMGDLELIVVDDASTDGTAELLARCGDPRLVVLRNEENLGLTRSLNRALGAARGAFVARQDADDRSRPQRLERQLAFLATHRDVGICGAWVRHLDGEGRPVGTGHPPTGPDELTQALQLRNDLVHGTILARREVLEELGGYREAFRYAQDYDLYLRALGRHGLANVAEELYELRFHRDALSTTHLELQDRYRLLARELWTQRRERGHDELEAGVPVEVLLEALTGATERDLWRRRTVNRRLTGDLKGYRRALAALIRLHPQDPRPWVHLAVSLGGRRAVERVDRAWLALQERRG